eukprot:6171899-Pleurochrysis_carterae.AAC.3
MAQSRSSLAHSRHSSKDEGMHQALNGNSSQGLQQHGLTRWNRGIEYLSGFQDLYSDPIFVEVERVVPGDGDGGRPGRASEGARGDGASASYAYHRFVSMCFPETSKPSKMGSAIRY